MTPDEHRVCFDETIRALDRGWLEPGSRLAALPAGERQLFLSANLVTNRLQPMLDTPGLPAAAAVVPPRVGATVAMAARLQQFCDERGVPVVFPKALQHYPDMGHDIDLWTLAPAAALAGDLRAELGATVAPAGTFGRLAGKRSYSIPGSPAPLEVHHGGVGHLGEHRELLADVLARRRSRLVDGLLLKVPSDEDQLIVQALQRMLGHFSVRASDLSLTAALVSRPLDWKHVERTAARSGLSPALGLWLAICADLWTAATGKSLPAPALALAAPTRVILVARGHVWRMHVPGLAARLYGGMAVDAIRRRRWHTLGRIAALPAAIAAFGLIAAGRSLRAAAGGPHP